MNTTIKNIIANYFGRFWSFISGFVFIPFYIKLLGIEAQGVISFSALLIAFMSLADVGLTSALSREVARSDNKDYISNLLFTVERIYFGICFGGFILVFLLSGLIAKNFLNAENLSITDLSNYVWMMGLAASLQMLASLYNGGLTGLQKQVLSNSLGVSYSIFRSVIGLFIVFLVPDLYIYFYWNIFSSIVYVVSTRYFLWKSIKTNDLPKFEYYLFKKIWRFAAGMMLMTIIAVLNSQVDKLFVGKLLSLKEFAYYSLGSFLGQLPLLLTMPIVVAILPKMTQLAENKYKNDLRKMYHGYSFIIAAIACAVGVVFVLYTKNLVFLWVGSVEIMNNVNIVAKTLVIGGMFLTFQFMPFYLSIANGHNKTSIKFGLAGLFLVIPAIYIFVSLYGLSGAGIPWAILNISFFIIFGVKLTNKFLKGETKKWFFYDIFLPLSVSIIIGTVIYLIPINYGNPYFFILKVVATGILSLFGSLFIYNKVFSTYRIEIIKSIKGWKKQ